jgi:hypothetical protein
MLENKLDVPSSRHFNCNRPYLQKTGREGLAATYTDCLDRRQDRDCAPSGVEVLSDRFVCGLYVGVFVTPQHVTVSLHGVTQWAP